MSTSITEYASFHLTVEVPTTLTNKAIEEVVLMGASRMKFLLGGRATGSRSTNACQCVRSRGNRSRCRDVQTFGDVRVACPSIPGGAVGSAVPDTPRVARTRSRRLPSSRLGCGSGAEPAVAPCFTNSRACGARNGGERRFPPGHPND